MHTVIAITATIAIANVAIIFGTDVLAAVVLRPVYAGVDDRTLVQAVGRGHHVGDMRLPVVGVLGVVATAATAALGFVDGAPLIGALAAAALLALVIWLSLFGRVAKPINARLSAAALADEVPADARALQDRWESIIAARAILQGVAVVLLCSALALV